MRVMNPSVINEHIDTGIISQKCFGSFAHICEPRKIRQHNLNLSTIFSHQIFSHPGSLLSVSTHDHDMCPALCKTFRSLVANPGCRSSDNADAPIQTSIGGFLDQAG